MILARQGLAGTSGNPPIPVLCNPMMFGFVRCWRGVVAPFDGGVITSDAGARLPGGRDRAIHVTGRFAAYCTHILTSWHLPEPCLVAPQAGLATRPPVGGTPQQGVWLSLARDTRGRPAPSTFSPCYEGKASGGDQPRHDTRVEGPSTATGLSSGVFAPGRSRAPCFRPHTMRRPAACTPCCSV
jgi:hypothetical protein